MTTPTAGELALLRTQPHKTKLYLSIFEPQTVFQAQVNDATIAKGDRVITYDNVTFGNFLSVGGGMTMYVGTTSGGKEKGEIWVYKRDATTITVGENGHINWEDDDYLTIVNFHQIWPVYPRYEQDGENITVYKFYDLAYNGQNEDPGSFLVMGSNYAGFIDQSTGTAQVYWDGSECENVVGTTGSTFSWSFEGASNITGSTDTTPGWVTYDTPGHYRVLLSVTTPGGKTDFGIRHVSIYERPEEGDNTPILLWGMEGFSGSREAGGYTANLWVKENVSSVTDGALVIIFADDWYGTTQQSIGGNSPQREHIVFAGYIIGETIEYDYQTSTVNFDVGSPSEIMKLGEAFSVSVEDSNDPTADASAKGGDPWFYFVGLSTKSALYHYYAFHSSVQTLVDIRYVGDSFDIQFFDADRASLYDAANTFLKSTVHGAAVCDRQGGLYFEIDAGGINNASSSLNQSMFIDNHDWMGNPDIEERQVFDVSYIEMGGVAYTNYDNGGDGSFTAVLAGAPGTVPAYRGRNMKLSGYALTNQNQLNTLAGNVWENMNAKYPSVNLDLVGNYRNLDIAPQEVVTMTLQSGDTFRGLTWEQKAFTPRSMSWVWNAEQYTFLGKVELREITQGNAAQSISIPATPPSGGFEQPPIPLPPPVPPISIPTFANSSFFVPAMVGITSGNDLLNFGSQWTSPSTKGSIGVGIQLDDDTMTTAEGWFMMPAGTTSCIIYMVLTGRSDPGDFVFETDVLYGPCGITDAEIPQASTDKVTIDNSPYTDAAHICVNPLTVPAVSGDICQIISRRWGGDAADTNLFRTFLFGWSVFCS